MKDEAVLIKDAILDPPSDCPMSLISKNIAAEMAEFSDEDDEGPLVGRYPFWKVFTDTYGDIEHHLISGVLLLK